MPDTRAVKGFASLDGVCGWAASGRRRRVTTGNCGPETERTTEEYDVPADIELPRGGAGASVPGSAGGDAGLDPPVPGRARPRMQDTPQKARRGWVPRRREPTRSATREAAVVARVRGIDDARVLVEPLA
jgi:hypothetical protein